LPSQPQIKSALIAASLTIGVSTVDAAAPVVVDGWRYIEGPHNLQVYVCDRSDCVKGSRVVCSFDPPNSATFLGIWRKQEAAVSALLGEQSKTFSPSSIEFATGRMYGLATSSDGSTTYYEFGDVKGREWRASLSSASRDEKASRANLEQFEATLKRARN
jgi:hypothetical protein